MVREAYGSKTRTRSQCHIQHPKMRKILYKLVQSRPGPMNRAVEAPALASCRAQSLKSCRRYWGAKAVWTERMLLSSVPERVYIPQKICFSHR